MQKQGYQGHARDRCCDDVYYNYLAIITLAQLCGVTAQNCTRLAHPKSQPALTVMVVGMVTYKIKSVPLSGSDVVGGTVRRYHRGEVKE